MMHCVVQVQAVVTLSGAPSPYSIVCPSKQEACPQLVDELPCPRDCSTPNGECNTMTGSCECNEGWTGDGCSEYICTGSECLAAGANEGEEAQGTCEDGTCSCAAGYTGVDCRVQQPQCDRDCSLLVCPPRSSSLLAAALHVTPFARYPWVQGLQGWAPACALPVDACIAVGFLCPDTPRSCREGS